jgi:hypothetical protein
VVVLNKLKILVVLLIVGFLVVAPVAAPPPIPGPGPPSDPAGGFSLIGVMELFGIYLLFLYLFPTKRQTK